jgi:arsenate reductase
MAEAIVNARLGDQWHAVSAGTQPQGYVHPMALRALEEIGIHHEGRSKSADEFQNTDFDLVVTLCDSAAEQCPIWLGKGKRVHRGFVDPFNARGSGEEILDVYRGARDEIGREIPKLLQDHSRSGRNT